MRTTNTRDKIIAFIKENPKITGKELAAKLGISQSAVSQYNIPKLKSELKLSERIVDAAVPTSTLNATKPKQGQEDWRINRYYAYIPIEQGIQAPIQEGKTHKLSKNNYYKVYYIDGVEIAHYSHQIRIHPPDKQHPVGIAMPEVPESEQNEQAYNLADAMDKASKVHLKRNADGTIPMWVKQEEIARTHNGIARRVLKSTRKFKVYDANNTLRIVIDDSPAKDPIAILKRLKELETVSPAHAAEDQAEINKLLSDVAFEGAWPAYRDGILKVDEANARHEKEIAEVRGLLLELSKENKAMAVNQTTHIPFFQSQTAVNNAILAALAGKPELASGANVASQGARADGTTITKESAKAHKGILKRLRDWLW